MGTGAGTAGTVALGLGTVLSDGVEPGVGLSDGLGVALAVAPDGAEDDGDGAGTADGGTAVSTTASTTAAASSRTAIAAASHRRRLEKRDRMLHCGTTRRRQARAEGPAGPGVRPESGGRPENGRTTAGRRLPSAGIR